MRFPGTNPRFVSLEPCGFAPRQFAAADALANPLLLLSLAVIDALVITPLRPASNRQHSNHECNRKKKVRQFSGHSIDSSVF
jgi:hypothetical protein